jgi:hypothetical protein
LALAAFLAPAPLAAQNTGLSGEDYLTYLSSLAAQGPASARQTVRRTRGASTVGVPSGFTLARNMGFAAVAMSDHRERTSKQEFDGSLAFGLGFGDARNALGFEAILGISSVGGSSTGGGFDISDFGDSGSLNLKISKEVGSPFRGEIGSVALGIGRAVRWGDMSDEDPNYYLAYTSTFGVPTGDYSEMSGLVSFGYGTAIGTQEDKKGAFVGVGLGVTDWLSVGGSWYGDEFVAGLSSTIDLKQDLSLQVGLSYGDVTKQNSEGRWNLTFALVDAKLF